MYDINNSRYVLDALYGTIYLPDYIWKILFTPEIQRLRELRLYNINSLYFTGGANINRYEHSLGTCYLALQCIDANLNSISEKSKMLIVLSALLHDLYNGAFGHSVEYVEDFSPEDLFSYAVTGKNCSSFKYKHTEFEPIYFGMCEEIYSKFIHELKLSNADIDKISKYINGKGEYGPLISGSIDLDNIDNIFRMSYHMGLVQDTKAPIKTARSIWAENGNLYIKKDSIYLINDWIKHRKKLYKYLLLNPDEFSAKFMLTEAIEISNENNNKVYAWYDTDFQILEKLSKSTSEVSNIISRLMKGCLYGCFGIYRTTKIEKYPEISKVAVKRKIENELNAIVRPEVSEPLSNFSEKEKKLIRGLKGIYYDENDKSLKITYKAKYEVIKNLSENDLKKRNKLLYEMYSKMQEKQKKYKLKYPSFGIHIITDINKTNREVCFKTENKENITMGSKSRFLYIGVFMRNVEFMNFNVENNYVMHNEIANNIKSEIRRYLSNYLNDKNLVDLKLYSEVLND